MPATAENIFTPITCSQSSRVATGAGGWGVGGGGGEVRTGVDGRFDARRDRLRRGRPVSRPACGGGLGASSGRPQAARLERPAARLEPAVVLHGTAGGGAACGGIESCGRRWRRCRRRGRLHSRCRCRRPLPTKIVQLPRDRVERTLLLSDRVLEELQTAAQACHSGQADQREHERDGGEEEEKREHALGTSAPGALSDSRSGTNCPRLHGMAAESSNRGNRVIE